MSDATDHLRDLDRLAPDVDVAAAHETFRTARTRRPRARVGMAVAAAVVLVVLGLAATLLAADGDVPLATTGEDTDSETRDPDGTAADTSDVVDYEDIDLLWVVGPDAVHHNFQADLVDERIHPWGEARPDVYAGAFVAGGTVYVGFIERHEELLAEVRALVPELPAREVLAFRAEHPYSTYLVVLSDLDSNAAGYAEAGAPIAATMFDHHHQVVGVTMAGDGSDEDHETKFARLLELVDHPHLLWHIGPLEPSGG